MLYHITTVFITIGSDQKYHTLKYKKQYKKMQEAADCTVAYILVRLDFTSLQSYRRENHFILHLDNT